MKPVSRAYKQAMLKPMRDHSYCIITFGNTDVTAITDGQWVSSPAQISQYTTLDYEHNYDGTIATLELNRWSLDGKSVVSDGQNDGYISAPLSDADGDIDIVLHKDFELPHTLSGLTFTFDTREKEYPTEAMIVFDGDDPKSETFYPDSTEFSVELPSTGVTQMQLHFSKLLPYRRARLEKIQWGIGYVFRNENIVNTKQTHDVDPLSRRLADEKFSFTIFDYEHRFDPDNPQGTYVYINKGAPLQIQFGYEIGDGIVEWLKPDKYSLVNEPTFKDNKVTFSGIGLIGSMKGKYYKSTVGTKSLYDMAVDVLEDAGLPLTPDGENPWDIDETLQDMETTAVLPIDTHANCLQLIAHAARCKLYTDDDNVIHIEPFGVTIQGLYSGTYTDDGHMAWSSWDNVPNGIEGNETVSTLELNRWIFGDGQYIYGSTPIDEGFVGKINGSEITYVFDVVHDVPVLMIRFDDAFDTYPKTLTVNYYDADNELVTSETANYENLDGDSTFKILSDEAYDIKKIVISCTELSNVRTRIRNVQFRDTDFTLSLDSIKQNSHSISKLEKLRNVLVTEYSYAVSDNSTVLYEATTDSTELHIEYQLADDVEITGATPLTSHIYGRSADFTFASGTKHIVVTGKPIQEIQRVHTENYNVSGDDDVEENPLITNTDMATALSAHVGQYLQLRNTYDDAYRGNPELETGDTIGLQTLFSDNIYGIVLVDEISFNGALSGKLKVKGLI